MQDAPMAGVPELELLLPTVFEASLLLASLVKRFLATVEVKTSLQRDASVAVVPIRAHLLLLMQLMLLMMRMPRKGQRSFSSFRIFRP